MINELMKLLFRDESFLQKVKYTIDNMPNRIEAVIATKVGEVNVESGLSI